LMYQVVWARKLQLTFGVSIFAIASVLAAYFLGKVIRPVLTSCCGRVRAFYVG
jgi:hypothetical protein